MQSHHIPGMTTAAAKIPPGFHADLPERLASAGLAPEAVSALLALDSEMFAWHRRVVKGELPARIIAETGLDLDLGEFTALTAISRIEHGVGRNAPEPATVGLLAEELAIDPSRASRVASGLIEAGWVRREAAQEDARKSILVLTEQARAAFRQFRDLKWEKLLEVFADWNTDDIAAFSRLFTRYSEGVARAYSTED